MTNTGQEHCHYEHVYGSCSRSEAWRTQLSSSKKDQKRLLYLAQHIAKKDDLQTGIKRTQLPFHDLSCRPDTALDTALLPLLPQLVKYEILNATILAASTNQDPREDQEM